MSLDILYLAKVYLSGSHLIKYIIWKQNRYCKVHHAMVPDLSHSEPGTEGMCTFRKAITYDADVGLVQRERLSNIGLRSFSRRHAAGGGTDRGTARRGTQRHAHAETTRGVDMKDSMLSMLL